MRELREIAEKIGYATAKYEESNKGEHPEVARSWANQVTILRWVLGEEWVALPVMAKPQSK